jgi:hypothetical protein
LGDDADIALKALGLNAYAGQTKRENQEGGSSVLASSASRNFRVMQ